MSRTPKTTRETDLSERGLNPEQRGATTEESLRGTLVRSFCVVVREIGEQNEMGGIMDKYRQSRTNEQTLKVLLSLEDKTGIHGM